MIDDVCRICANTLLTKIDSPQPRTLDSLDNRLTNSESGQLATFMFDASSRITSSIEGTAVTTRTTYTYQPDGLKWSEVSGATSTTLVWDGDAYLGTA